MKKNLKMNIALFTSNHLRHKYIAAEIAKSLSLKLIISEEKSDAIQDVSKYNEEDRQLLINHFKNRATSEEAFFGVYQNFPDHVPLIKMKFGSLNTEGTLKLLNEYKIDCILLFGTSIIKPIILNKYLGNTINLHLGLSPYYKGSGTNFFPIVNNEFECLGATIHLAIDKVDAGDILHQFRINNIEENDTVYSIGNKIIDQAGILYPKVVKNYLKSKITPKIQNEFRDVKIYKINDFTPDALLLANQIIKNDGVKNYLRIKSQYDSAKPIVANDIITNKKKGC